MKAKIVQKNIPEGWIKLRLGDIGKAIIGLTYSPEDVLELGGVLVFRSSNIKNGRINYADQVRVSSKIPESLKIKEGDILICARNGSQNLIGQNAYIAKQDEGHTFGAFMTVFRTKNPKYFYQLFQSQLFKKEVKKDLGPTINQVTTGNLHSFKFKIPPSGEQNRIVNVLEAWDMAIEKLGEKIEIKKRVKKGLMRELLTGKTRLPGFSGEWKAVKLGDVCKINMGQSPPSTAYNENMDGLPLIQGNNDIKFRKTTRRVWTTEITKTADAGDIIMTVRAPVGCIGIADEKVCIGRGVCAIKPQVIDHDFILKILELRESNWKSLEQGSTFTAVNSLDIKKLLIKAPASIKEQNAIADILTAADEEIEGLERKLGILKEQKRFLLNKLVTGEIRVPEGG